MIERIKRGSGQNLDPYYNYKHLQQRLKDMQSQKRNSNSSEFHIAPETYDQKRLLQIQRQNDNRRLRNNSEMLLSNMKLYNKLEKTLPETVHQSWLDQKGPKSLNFVNKKQQIKKINIENQKIKASINEAKSRYSLLDKSMIEHQVLYFQKKESFKIFSQSSSNTRLDPMLKKVIIQEYEKASRIKQVSEKQDSQNKSMEYAVQNQQQDDLIKEDTNQNNQGENQSQTYIIQKQEDMINNNSSKQIFVSQAVNDTSNTVIPINEDQSLHSQNRFHRKTRSVLKPRPFEFTADIGLNQEMKSKLQEYFDAKERESNRQYFNKKPKVDGVQMARMRNKQQLYKKLNITTDQQNQEMKVDRDNSQEKLNNYSDKPEQLNLDLLNVKSNVNITIPNHLYEQNGQNVMNSSSVNVYKRKKENKSVIQFQTNTFSNNDLQKNNTIYQTHKRNDMLEHYLTNMQRFKYLKNKIEAREKNTQEQEGDQQNKTDQESEVDMNEYEILRQEYDIKQSDQIQEIQLKTDDVNTVQKNKSSNNLQQINEENSQSFYDKKFVFNSNRNNQSYIDLLNQQSKMKNYLPMNRNSSNGKLSKVSSIQRINNNTIGYINNDQSMKSLISQNHKKIQNIVPSSPLDLNDLIPKELIYKKTKKKKNLNEKHLLFSNILDKIKKQDEEIEAILQNSKKLQNSSLLNELNEFANQEDINQGDFNQKNKDLNKHVRSKSVHKVNQIKKIKEDYEKEIKLGGYKLQFEQVVQQQNELRKRVRTQLRKNVKGWIALETSNQQQSQKEDEQFQNV